MDSLQWVDQTYYAKHRSEDPKTLRATYFAELRMYSAHGDTSKHRAPMDAALAFLIRFGRRAGISLAIYALSYLPIVGRFVLPAASFYTFNNAVGPIPATIIFGSGIFLPRRYLIVFLQSYFSSRSLMRELVRGRTPKAFTFSLQTNELMFSIARTLLLPNPFHERTKETLVPRSRGRAVWIRCRFLHLPQNTAPWCLDLRHCRSIDGISDYQNHGSSTVSGIQREICGKSGQMDEQAEVPGASIAQSGC